MPTQRVTIVPVRLSNAELKVIDTLARKMGISRSTLLRTATLEKAESKGISLPEEKRH